jgi:hypothetical protein
VDVTLKATKIIGYGLILVVMGLNYGLTSSSWAAPPADQERQNLPPVIISDDTFFSFPYWTITEQVVGSGSSTANQQSSGGNPGAFRFMSHRLPPVSGSEANFIIVNHIYHQRYDPRFEGEIRAIDYVEDGIILSFPFAEAFSTTQPALEQDGRLYRSSRFFRFIAQNSSHSWETQGLSQLTAADFVAADGSGDHPDFSVRGSPIRFGFTRNNSRTISQPPVPGNQDMVIDQGVDNWQVTIYRDNTNRPPQAVDDVFVLDGNQSSLPLLEFFDVVRNDSDPNQNPLEVIEVTEPAYGSTGILSAHTIVYQLDEARASDVFNYTISDGLLTSSAGVQVYIDCACTVLCLNSLELPEPPSSFLHATDTIDLPLIYRVRDQILKPTLDGRRYVDMYYTNNPEILVNIMTNEPLRIEAVATVELWQNNLRSLTDGNGSAVITQAQVNALKSFLNNLSAVSSSELQQLITGELVRLGPLDDYVGMTVKAAKTKAIGDPTLYLPLIKKAH